MSFEYKTKSQQKLEYLQSLKRPLDDEESEALRKSMHAVYCRARHLAQHEREEKRLLKQLLRESKMRSVLS